jgi:adenosylcobyric acid synthase
VPFFVDAHKLPAEDVLALEQGGVEQKGEFIIYVLRLSRISNFDDFDPLIAEKGVRLEFIEAGRPIPQDADLIIIPGTKATIADMKFIQAQGWDIDIKAHVRTGGLVLGICGGYQILGREISDPLGIEGSPQTIEGLALLDIKTTLGEKKRLDKEQAMEVISGELIEGFHMHMGVSEGGDCERPFAKIGEKNEGAICANGRVIGTYLHGLFIMDGFRQAFLRRLGAIVSEEFNYQADVEQVLNDLAKHLEKHLDLDALLEMAK